MAVTGKDRSLDSRDVFRVIGALNGDIGYHLDRGYIEPADMDFDLSLIGSGGLAVWAERRGENYKTRTKDVDMYPVSGSLEGITDLPHATMSREDGSQYNYNVTAAAGSVPDVFVDFIVDFEAAFDWDAGDARTVAGMLEEDMEESEPVSEGRFDVYLPSLETLKATFEFSNRDYSDRIEKIEEMF
ncbi:MAG: hypothetical protein ABEJ91_03725 [Candidatus Nanohaloarchaea archaeon]